ncbi:15881_t:CDS:1 [Entrophospora sp. SA101]|nr:15881_t:CDS:1 [Entrophospora sp. SA101]
MTQDLFDYITNESSVSSSSKSIAKQWDFVPTDISLPPKIVNVEVVDDKSKSPEIIELVNDEPEISLDLSTNDEPKTSNEEETESRISDSTPTQISYPPGYQTREQREIHLRECAVKRGENPDKFITITEKDRDLARIYYDKIMADAEIIEFARGDGADPEKYMELSRREKLICMEIDLWMYEDKGEPRSYTCIYNDEDWAKNIAILQENGYLW